MCFGDIERHLDQNSPWVYKLSRVYDAPEGTDAVTRRAAEHQEQIAP